jgi:cytosine/uracil/thiamine/allantoin permease
MSSGGPSNFFLIAGVVINVVLTGLAIWWLVKQGVKKPPKDAPPPDQS